MIGLLEKVGHERKRQVEDQFVYHECRLSSIAARFKSDIQLIGLDEAVIAS